MHFSSSFMNHCLVLLSRLSISFLMLTHGIPKLNKLLAGGEIKFADPLGLGPTLSLILVVFSEVICSLFIAMGFKSRLATIPLIITMLVAAFITHANDGLYKQEKALLYIVAYILIFITGSGRFSIDYLLEKNSKNKR